jgi:hypothetical protein
MSKIIGVDTANIDNISGLGTGGGGGEAHVLTYPSTGTIAYGGLSLSGFPFDWSTFFSDIPAYAYELSTTQFTKIQQNSGHILALDSSNNLYHKTSDNTTNAKWGNTVYNEFELSLTNVARFILCSNSGYSSWALAIKTDGTLWGVGYNYYGVLGLGNQTNQTSWVQVGSDTDWKDIVGGNYNSYALKGGASNTYLYAAGRNNYGATGQGTTSGFTTSFTRVKSASATDWSENLNYSAGSFKFGGSGNGCMVINSSGELFMFGRAGQEFPSDLDSSIARNSSQTYVVQIGTDTDWQQLVLGNYDVAFRKGSTGSIGLYVCGNMSGFQGSPNVSYNIAQYGTDTDWDVFDDSIQHGYGASQASARCFKKNGVISLWGQPGSGAWNSPTTNVTGINANTLYNFPSGSTINSLSVNVAGSQNTVLILSVS